MFGYLNKFIGRKPKKPVQKTSKVREVINQEMSGYIKKEDLPKFVEELKKDERKKQIWNSLSPKMKRKIAQRIDEKRSQDARKKERD
jgi:hypothetical protein